METRLKPGRGFPHSPPPQNVEGSSHGRENNPATIRRNAPATTGCPINDFRPKTTSSHMTRLVPAESCNFRPQPKPEKRNDCADAECVPGTRFRVPAQCG